MLKILNKDETYAGPGYNRYWVVVSALSIHLCIGQIYAYSVFNDPMTRILGINESTPEDWKLTQLGWVFSIALFTLGASAALFGKWLEREGPRKAMFLSAVCFGGGFVLASLGIQFHSIWLLYLGHGILGGIGLGLGYISPVSTLIKWFPDRPGMATGMAIMGFGGGAMLASPLSVWLMDLFASESTVGVSETFLVMGVLYFLVMSIGAFSVRIPTIPGSKSVGNTEGKLVGEAIRTKNFWMVFMVLLLNVTAGIGVLGQASVMIQGFFSASVQGSGKVIDPKLAALFVGLLSLFNMIGRFFWSSFSDRIGRKMTYSTFFIVGALLYSIIPFTGEIGSPLLFVGSFCVIISMYGGGFATVPAYLKDLFGVREVGAIHGRLLLAWSIAAILGPVLVNYIRAYQIEELNLPPSRAYSITMYIMAGLLILGFFFNSRVDLSEDQG